MCFLDHFESLEDPRSTINRSHDLLDIVFLTVSAVLSGAQGWKDIKDFGDVKLPWLRQFRAFEHGIPVDDTIARVISTLAPEAMMSCFIDWVNELRAAQGAECIAIDGKTFRRSHDGEKKEALHALNAWSSTHGLVLAQMKSAGKKNEIATAQQMIEMLELKGATVTLDAMHCQRDTAKAIVKKKGDYVLNVKKNQLGLYESVADLFDGYEQFGGWPDERTQFEQVDSGHGRIEERHYTCLPVPKDFQGRSKWTGLKTLIRVTRIRHVKDTISTETLYYIASLDTADSERIARAIRSHWEVENKVHWVLDVTFREDDCRIRGDDGAQNIGLVRRMCLNLTRMHPKRTPWRESSRPRGGTMSSAPNSSSATPHESMRLP